MAADIWDMFRDRIPEVERQALAKKLYDIFCEKDADDWIPDGRLEQDAGLADKDGNWL